MTNTESQTIPTNQTLSGRTLRDPDGKILTCLGGALIGGTVRVAGSLSGQALGQLVDSIADAARGTEWDRRDKNDSQKSQTSCDKPFEPLPPPIGDSNSDLTDEQINRLIREFAAGALSGCAAGLGGPLTVRIAAEIFTLQGTVGAAKGFFDIDFFF